MKLLVTGGSGFLGRRTAAHFVSLGWQVLTPAHNHLDITDFSALRDWFGKNTPDVVIHTAAVSDTMLCQQKPEWSEDVNVTGCVNLAKACKENGAKLVMCSSDQVYFGSAVTTPHRENETLSPGNVYGSQKLRAEQNCLAILPETVCLRLSWMYARESFPGEHGHFLTTLKAALADNSKLLCYPVHDRRGITNAEYVVKNLPAAIKLPGGVYNFGSENDCDTYTTMKSIFEEAGNGPLLRRLQANEEAFSDNPRNLTMDLTKLNAAGITFPTTKDGLCRALGFGES